MTGFSKPTAGKSAHAKKPHVAKPVKPSFKRPKLGTAGKIKVVKAKRVPMATHRRKR